VAWAFWIARSPFSLRATLTDRRDLPDLLEWVRGFLSLLVDTGGMSTDELQEYGLVEMDDSEIQGFLSSQKVGVLGLPEEDGPYLFPLSFGYDGGERLYFTYLLGSGSHKAAATEATDTASFLVYKVDTMYNWESVLLSGSIAEVPESEWDSLEELLSNVWRPSVLEAATKSGAIAVYEFRIDQQTGIKHQGLPPALEQPEE